MLGKSILIVACLAVLGIIVTTLHGQSRQVERPWQLIKQDVETHWDGPDTTCYVLIDAMGKAVSVSCVHHQA